MKRPTKRKMYQKRRKKEKAEQRKKESQVKLAPSTSAASYKYKNTIKTNQRKLNNYPTGKTQNPAISPITSYSQGLQLWWQTYCSAIEFHTNQNNAWKDDRNDHQLMLLEKYANEYETSSEEEDDNDEYGDTTQSPSGETNFDHEIKNDDVDDDDENVDEEYIKFLEVTHKHREELRMKRAAENV